MSNMIILTLYFIDDLFADLGATTKKSKPKKTITLDDDDLFGDPLGGLK